MATGLLAATQGFFTCPSHKKGSLSELINSPPRHLDARKIFNYDDSDHSESSCPPSPTPLKRPRQSLSPTHSTASTPSPSKSPKKRARTKSPEYPATREIGVMANTLPPSQDVKRIVDERMAVLVESLYQRCIPSSTPEANSVLVSNSMSLEIRDFLLAYLHRDPPPAHHPSEWTPPKFTDVHDYCYNLCKEDRSIIPFGRYNGDFMKLSANGRVECWDGDTNSFREEGILTFSRDKGTHEHVDVVVLGTIAGTGTAQSQERVRVCSSTRLGTCGYTIPQTQSMSRSWIRNPNKPP